MLLAGQWAPIVATGVPAIISTVFGAVDLLSDHASRILRLKRLNKGLPKKLKRP